MQSKDFVKAHHPAALAKMKSPRYWQILSEGKEIESGESAAQAWHNAATEIAKELVKKVYPDAKLHISIEGCMVELTSGKQTPFTNSRSQAWINAALQITPLLALNLWYYLRYKLPL